MARRKKKRKKKSQFEKSAEGVVAAAQQKEDEALEKWRKSHMQTHQYFLKFEKAKARTARALQRWQDEIEWNQQMDEKEGAA